MDKEVLEGLRTSYDFYKLFQTNKLVQDIIIPQSKMYATQHGMKMAGNLINADLY